MIHYLFRNLEELLGSALLAAVCILACVKITSRYVYVLGKNFFTEFIGDAGTWSEEACTYLFIWLVFTGASLAYKRNQHFAVDFIIERLNKKHARAMHILINCMVIIFSLIITYEGVRQAIHGLSVITPVLEFPRAIPYAAVPAGGILLLSRAVERLAEEIRGKELSA